jgi:2-keto-4-pentenoate hydratase/2-oxohepta-3-ene-1,7-dioic acid hydratase in catechol pathway
MTDQEPAMKLATFAHEGADRVGVVVDDRIYDLAGCLRAAGEDANWADTTVNVLTAGPDALVKAQQSLRQADGNPALVKSVKDVILRAPLPNPGKLLCLAGNYAAHIEEGGATYVGKEKMIPRFFMKPTTTIIATGEAIRVPASTAFADWELELAVVIGKQGRDLTPEQAQDHIAGYTIFNDISARELTFRQHLPKQEGDAFFDWLVGKWLDTFGPMGPWITLKDEVPHPDRLGMKLWHNGELQQDANTGQMIFSPAEAIAFISQFVTLYPGDLISTGTPAGVGHAKKVRLNPGDQIRGEIEGLGVLENRVESWG